MFRLKNILTLLLAVSVITAGFPVQAKQQCPMAAQMQMQKMDMKDCKGCDKMTQQDQQKKKGGCCGDMNCAAKCSSMSNAGTMFFGNQATLLSFVGISTERFYVSDDVLASHLLNTQDRPPKYLS